MIASLCRRRGVGGADQLPVFFEVLGHSAELNRESQQPEYGFEKTEPNRKARRALEGEGDAARAVFRGIGRLLIPG